MTRGGGALKCIGVHMHEQNKQVKGVFFAVEGVKQGTHLGVLNAMFQEKGVVLSRFTKKSLDSNLFRGSNLRQNPTKALFRGDFFAS